MKRCPECRRDYYDDTLLYCLDDGNALLDGPGSQDEPATAILHATAEPREPATREHLSQNQTKDHPLNSALKQSHHSDADVLRSTLGRHKFGAAALFAAAMIMLGGFGYGLYRFIETPAAEPPKTPVEVKTQRLTGDGKSYFAEISPDGKFLAYVKHEGDDQGLWIKQIQTNSTVPIVKPRGLNLIAGLAFSPDGGFGYFSAWARDIRISTIYRVPILGGAPTKVVSNATMPQFSPKGDRISFQRLELTANKGDIFIANADGSNERRIVSRSGTDSIVLPPAWSPDGKYITVGYRDNSLAPEPSASIKLVSVADGAQSDLGSFRWSMIDDFVWHPSGDSLIVVAGDRPIGGAQIWEVLYPSGAVRRLTNNPNGYYTVSVTSDGRSIVTSERYSTSAVWVSPDLKPENAKPVMPDTGDTWGLWWTPDDRIVFASDQTGSNEIWMMDADGSNAKPLTNDRVYKTIPVVSPDGRYIVYLSAANGGQLERIDIDGGNLMVFKGLGSPEGHDISHDGKWVIYDSLIDGVSRIFRVPIDGGEPQQLIDIRGRQPRYSSDGTRFACFLLDDKLQGWTKVGIFGADGGPPLKVFDGPPGTEAHRGPIWTPDGRGISIVVNRGRKLNLWLQPVSGGDPKQITNFDTPIYRRQYSRGGKRVAIVRGDEIANAIMVTGFR